MTDWDAGQKAGHTEARDAIVVYLRDSCRLHHLLARSESVPTPVLLACEACRLILAAADAIEQDKHWEEAAP